ncbi:MAG: DoxX family protein [Archangiaceae bacterium]|nr:DoxX family protein [Archangiaceae bacterium]
MWNKLISHHGARLSGALLLVRVVAGAFFVTHGWGKIQDPFHWMDKGGSPAPAVFQLLAALSEFGGGLAWVLGLLTPLACLGIGCTMVVAVFTTVSRGASFELAAVYLTLALLLLAAGPGRFSVDDLIARRQRPTMG